ncbi:hypothetical protein DL98DRAFT_416927, partial [Cadophora sp. DSE1049]
MDDSISPPDFNIPEFKANLNACLKSIKRSGTFATFNRMKSAPDPGIYLKNNASISLPLSDEDAQKIKMASHVAPRLEGEAVSVDSNVWEISSNELEIKNDAWKQRLRSIVTTACSSLGLYMTRDRRFSRTLFDSRSTEISAKLSKLLLCEKGALPEPSQCSEDVPGMFATMFIVLPTEHSGGEVTATHAGETKVFNSSQYSASEASWTAWFLDTQYEIKPILTGRRLVLRYNLIHAMDNSTILAEKAKDDAQIAQLRNLFSSWKNNFHNEQYPKTLGYVLDHCYPDFYSRYCLTGRDYHVGSHLRDACEEYGLSLYIAELEIKISGNCGDDDEIVALENGEGTDTGHVGFHTFADELDRQTVLRKVYGLDGTQIDRWLDFDEKSLVQQNAFAGLDPDEE